MKIEAGKFYLRVDNEFVIDAVEYNPERSDFQLYEAPSIPSDILSRCYKLQKGKLVLDADKHAAFLEETNKDTRIAELEAKIKELEAK
jgi:hypothetical protein